MIEVTAPPEILAARLATLDRPNLVLVLVDTLRADWTTPYGFEHDTSPELSRWAERGVLFERARAQSSWTKMSPMAPNASTSSSAPSFGSSLRKSPAWGEASQPLPRGPPVCSMRVTPPRLTSASLIFGGFLPATTR